MRALWIVCCLCLLSQLSQAQSYHKGVRISGDVLAAGLPVAALVTTLVEKDYQGTKQLVFSGVSAAAVTYLLKATVKKERPDGSNFHSFPSAHSAAAFAGATFLQRRYGWKFGVPAYVLSTYVAWSRVYAKKHDVWDVTAGAAGAVSNEQTEDVSDAEPSQSSEPNTAGSDTDGEPEAKEEQRPQQEPGVSSQTETRTEAESGGYSEGTREKGKDGR